MATSFSGGRIRREPPTMNKQLVNFNTCESSAPFFVICEPTPYLSVWKNKYKNVLVVTQFGYYMYYSLRFRMQNFLCVFLLAYLSSTDAESEGVYITQSWPGGFHGHFTLNPSQALHGWTVHLKFSKALDKFEVWFTCYLLCLTR
jgi:hypothetical protein